MIVARFSEYQEEARKTESYPVATRLHDHALGLASEAGEVCGKIKKIDRDGRGSMTDADRREIALELGDVLWYVSALCDDIGFTMSQVAEMNVEKLSSRAKRGTIGGSGDHR